MLLLILSGGCLLVANAWPADDFLPTGIESSLIWAGLIPIWLHILAILLLLAGLWWQMRKRRLAFRLGVCLLAASLCFGMLLPAVGRTQNGLTNLITVISSWEEFASQKDARVLKLDCSLLPFRGGHAGISAILHNPTDQPTAYVLTNPPFGRWWSYFKLFYSPRREPWRESWETIELAPGETIRYILPPSTAMLGAQVYVRAAHRDLVRPFVAFCNLWWDNRMGLYNVGVLCFLAGLLCLGIGLAPQQRANQ